MSVPAVLVTRARPGADETAAQLHAMGLHAIVSPLLELQACQPDQRMKLEDVQGLIFTSANGVRFFTEQESRRNLPAWCVGPATVAAARAAGFSPCYNADGDARDLAGLIMRAADAAAGRLVHVANAAAAGEMAAGLRAAGFKVDFAPLYAALPASALTQPAAAALRAGDVRAVLFHSAKGADAFAQLAIGFELSGVCALGVSQKALAPVAGLGWSRCDAAGAPNETALLETLRHVLGMVNIRDSRCEQKS